MLNKMLEEKIQEASEGFYAKQEEVIKFLLDSYNLPHNLQELRDRGYEIVRIQKQQPTDGRIYTIIKLCKVESTALVTMDIISI